MKISADFLKTYARQPMDLFVETGTGLGETLEVACQLFEFCYSVELRPDRHVFNSNKFRHQKNVGLMVGQSPKFIERVFCSEILARHSATFFLDAHYGGDGQAPDIQCPLIDELKAINKINFKVKPVIIIDDAPYFFSYFWQSGKAKPYTRSKWPTFEDIMAETIGYDCEVFKVRSKPKVLILR